jgi:8-oxo-dGTP pyrophosphatase MutT (NUDIX family)
MNGYFCLPSGRVEQGESFVQAAIREGAEEVGVHLRPDDLELSTTAHRTESDSDWVDLIFKVKQWDGELSNAEPDIHGELAWLDPNSLPENVVPSVRYYVNEYLKGKRYTEYGFDR